MAIPTPPFRVRRLAGWGDRKIAVTTTQLNQETGTSKRTPEWMVSFATLDENLISSVTWNGVDPLLGDAGNGLLNVVEKQINSDPIDATSSIKGWRKFTELFGWDLETTRHVGPDATGALLSSASVQQSPLRLVIASGAFAASVEKVVCTGRQINSITIVRLGHINGRLQVLQASLFRHCRIIRVQQQLDFLILDSTLVRRYTFIAVFGPDGKFNGVSVGRVDVEHGTSSSLSTDL